MGDTGIEWGRDKARNMPEVRDTEEGRGRAKDGL